MTLSATGLTVFTENTYLTVTGTPLLSQAHHVDVFACGGEKSSHSDGRGDIVPRLPFLPASPQSECYL